MRDEGPRLDRLDRWLNGLHRFSIRHPALVVALALLVMAVAAPGIARLRLRTDGRALIPEHAPAVRFDHQVRREFGVRDPIVVLVRPRHADGILNGRTLGLVVDLTRAFAGIPGLDSTSVRSLATERSDRFRPRTMTRFRLLEPVPETPAQLEQLRGDLDAFRPLTGTMVSLDRQAAAILVGTPPDADRTALVAAIRAAIARTDTAGHEVHMIGAPIAESQLGSHILEDLGSGLRPEGSAGEPDEPRGPISRLRFAIARHVGLLPLSIAIMTLVFLVYFRSLVATLLPLGEAAACLVVVFGTMGWAGVPVYLTMAVLPVILVSMGLADELHIFHGYRRHRAERPDAPVREVVRTAMDEMSRPVIASAMTTAVGFLSFAISPLAPVRAFGLFAAGGIVFCMLWTLTAIPALLVLLAPRGFHASTRAAGARSSRWSRIAGPFVRRPGITLAAATLALAVCVPGIRRVVVQDSWISGFARDSGFYRATQYFNRHFFGTHRLLLVLDAGRVELHGALPVSDFGLGELSLPVAVAPRPEALPGCSLIVSRRPGKRPVLPEHANSAYQGATPPVYDPPMFWSAVIESAARSDQRVVVRTRLDQGSPIFMMAPAPGETLDVAIRSQRLAMPGVMRSIRDLENFVRDQERLTVGGVLGPPDQIETAEFVTNDRDPESRVIPTDPEHVRWLWNAIETAVGPERVREWVDSRLQRGLVVVFMKNANYVDTARLMQVIREYARTRLAPEGITLGLAGDVAVSQALIAAIIDSQVRSLLLSLLGILVVIAVVFRSLRWGVVCMLPAGLSVAATFAFMGWSGMPLGVATSMFASMVLGVGVDFAIHLVERYRMLVARGVAAEEAIFEALAATGPAIAVNALAVALGFGILVLSRVPANAWLGAISLVSLLACLIATLIVIPAVLRLAGPGPKRPRVEA